MPVEFESSTAMTLSTSASGEASVSPDRQQSESALLPPPKKKRNLPGMPDPKAEVIALSPKTLLATNRFVCEICKKGFQRDQNLQLHRRGHNLPWKLRQRNGQEVKKRVYVCPEVGCVHHDPSRALGDLTGIKKHFCRKHGEKNWKCDKCSKKYAVQSDWKAHAKTCGTREYRCDCGTLFSRRDSFITHRAFCDALMVEENARPQTRTPVTVPPNLHEEKATVPLDQQMPPPPPPAVDQQDFPENTAGLLHYLPPAPVNSSNSSGTTADTSGGSSYSGTATTASVFASLFSSSGSATATTQRTSFSDLIGAMSRKGGTAAATAEPPSLCLSSKGPASFVPPAPGRRQIPTPPPSAHMSATALLQKAAQMGAAASSFSFLHGFDLASSSSAAGSDPQWRLQPPQEPTLLSAGLGLGLPYDSGGAAAGLPDMMLGSASLFSSKPATLDFLGLGMGPAGSAHASGLSALISSIGGSSRVNVCPPPPAGAYGGVSSTPAEALGWGRLKTQRPGSSVDNM